MLLRLDFLCLFTTVKLSLTNSKMSDSELYRYLICLGEKNLDWGNNPSRHITGDVQINGSENSKIVYQKSISTLAEVYDVLFADIITTNSRRKLISVWKQLLKIDVSIPSNDEIGEGSTYTKDNIIKGSCFCFPHLLAALVKYVISRQNPHRIDHREYRKAVEDFYHEVPTANIDLQPLETSLPLDRDTSKISKLAFRKLFKEIKSESLPQKFKHHNKIRIYSLNIKNSEFDLGGLSTFIKENIEHYVMSTLEEKSYYESDRTKLLTSFR